MRVLPIITRVEISREFATAAAFWNSPIPWKRRQVNADGEDFGHNNMGVANASEETYLKFIHMPAKKIKSTLAAVVRQMVRRYFDVVAIDEACCTSNETNKLPAYTLNVIEKSCDDIMSTRSLTSTEKHTKIFGDCRGAPLRYSGQGYHSSSCSCPF